MRQPPCRRTSGSWRTDPSTEGFRYSYIPYSGHNAPHWRASGPRQAVEPVGWVLAFWSAVDLDRDPAGPAGGEDRFGIEHGFRPAAAGDQTARAGPPGGHAGAGDRGPPAVR